MIERPIIDQNLIENFFREHLALFPGAKQLLSLRIIRHEQRLVFDVNVTIAKYDLTLQMQDDSIKEVMLRGSSDAGNKRLKSYHILKSLWNKGFNTPPYMVPEPLGYFPELHLLLYVNAPGKTLLSEFEIKQDRYEEKISKAIDWLIKFHELKPKNIPEAEYDWRKEKIEFEELLGRLKKKYANQTQRIESISQLILKKEKELLDEKEFSLVHGDFQPNNIIIDQSSVQVIDFNEALLYHELFDLIYFTTQTEFMLKRLQGIDLSDFLNNRIRYYFEKRGITEDDRTLKQKALFKARSLINIQALVTHDEGEHLLAVAESYAQKTI